ncbi:Gfo/Idh/MocA family oxidoreductase [candidate division KSB1 bacterium]|nr:Gfo/Idh/MocA family oxidoreductase [candidate division KSB1 bacterium]RQW02275.1 MAG: gfo/Idh/MocA family oxidoreductase [candidate division KSB1 bacterium]
MKNNMKSQDGFNRRQFIGSLAATGALAIACSKGSSGVKADYKNSTLLEKAPDGVELTAGVIGCGGRGTGAALNFLAAGNGLKVTALADTFKDRVENCRRELKAQANNDVPEENCHVGLEAWQKVIESDVDIIITATPPYFRPMIFDAAINAKKHVFMEKPVAVDPVGARKIMASSKKAESLGLNVVTGTQRRHQHHYIDAYKRLMAGAIGDIVAANVYWNQGQLWYRTKQSGWSDIEWMIRDWVNWTWQSGDHIVEQHVHNLDVGAWFMGKYPVKAVGMGSRQRRVTGDQYDNFSVDFVFDDGRHMHSMCRQINGCANNVTEYFIGTKGFAHTSSGHAKFYDEANNPSWEYLNPLVDGVAKEPLNPYIQEHVDLVAAIRGGFQIVEAEQTAKSTLTGIMGRISAYTGKEVTWEEMMNSDIDLTPQGFTNTDADFRTRFVMAAKPPIAVPGAEGRG